MKNLLFFIFFMWSIPVFSQLENESKSPFIRAYNFNNQKIEKGRFLNVSKDFKELRLINNTDTIKVPVAEISYLRTKRAHGHLVLIGAATGFAVGAILGISHAVKDDFYLGYDILYPGLFFGAAGGAFGAIGYAFKKSAIIYVEGSPDNLKEFAFQESQFSGDNSNNFNDSKARGEINRTLMFDLDLNQDILLRLDF